MLAVVLSFDEFPLRLLGCYGNFSSEMPCLNRIAAGSVVFDQHFGEDFSQSPDGHAWWTGCYHFPRNGTSLVSRMPSLPGFLTGIETHWLADNSPAPSVPLPGDARVEVGSSFADLIGQGCRWLDSTSYHGRRLLWLKAGPAIWDEFPLGDWGSPEMVSAGEAIDRAIEPLWQAVQRQSEGRRVMFVLTSACGKSLGERDQASQTMWAEEFVHLPLIVWHSEHPGGDRRAELTQSIDLPLTLLDFLERERPSSSEGESFLPLVRGEDIAGRNAITSGSKGVWESVHTQSFHFVRLHPAENSPDRPQRMFIKPDDVWDWQDVSAQEPELTELFSTQLDAFLESAKIDVPVRERIEALVSRWQP